MNKIFLDVGFYVGHALDYYVPLMDASWTVYAFEPNPALFPIQRFPFKINWIPKAVWTNDGEIDFALGGRDDASHVKSVRPTQDPVIKVPCIDFSKFVKELPETTIVCSFDAEGAEFPVLRKMLEDGTASRLDLLDVEFHHRIIEGESEATASLLRQTLEAEGIPVKLKIEL